MRVIASMAMPRALRRARTVAATGAVAALVLAPGAGSAQSLTPMRGTVAAFGESFALQVEPRNPYQHRIGVEMRVYDHEFRPVPSARVVPDRFMLGGGASRPVTAYVPFEGQSPRYVRVCAESIPFRSTSSQQIRTRVCGKFRALQR